MTNEHIQITDADQLPVRGVLMRNVVIPLVRQVPPVRAIGVMASRGTDAFTLRRGTGVYVTQEEHFLSRELFSHLYENHAYPRHETGGFFMLSDEQIRQEGTWRQRNLIVVGGPERNALMRELIDDRRLLEHIHYRPGAGEGTMSRAFFWRHRVFTGGPTRDYALIAIKRSPFNPRKWVTLIFGFGRIGTLAAARLFCDPAYHDWRKRLSRLYGTRTGGLEVLIAVRHDGHAPSDIEFVDNNHGLPIDDDVRHNLDPYSEPLRRLYESLDKHPPAVLIPKLILNITIHPEFAVEYEQIATWQRHEDDVLIRGMAYRGDEPLPDWSVLGFSAATPSARHEIVFLPALDRPRQKGFLLFPIPPLRSADRTLDVVTRATWPRTLAELHKPRGKDYLEVTSSPGVAKNIDEATFNIRFKTPGLRYELRELFSHPGHEARTVQLHGTDTHELTLRDVPSSFRVKFMIERLD